MNIDLYDYFDLKVKKGEGIYIFDDKNNKYIDTFSGIGVTVFGHSNKKLLKVMKEKMNRYIHLSNFFKDEDLEIVSKKLIEFTGKDGVVYFSNSGTEATEAVLKAVKKNSNSKKNKIVYFKNSFHGRTLGALSINGFEKLKNPFKELLPNCVELEFNKCNEIEEYMNNNGEEVLAVFLEVIQGSGGVNSISSSFSELINRYQKKCGFYLVCDEIQAGLGRTGKFFSFQHYNLDPDIITLGKSLGGGLPLGAAIFLKDTKKILKKGDHGSTFSPNPIALSGARFMIENIPKYLNSINKKSEYFFKKLKKINNSKVLEIRGKGLMIGIKLDNSYPELKNRAFENNLLINLVSNNSIIRLLPSYNVKYSEIDEIIEKIKKILKN
jgi:acetylornithine/N-succinyldiaminopimelate aminotransferase